MGCDDQKNRCRGGCDLRQSGSCELRLRRSIPILRLVGLSSGLFLGILVSLDDGTHGLGEVISPVLHQDLVLFEESGCPERLLDRVCRVIRQGYFGDGSCDCCSFICPVPEAVPDPVWHRRYLKLFEEEWEPVSCNVIGPTHRREDLFSAGSVWARAWWSSSWAWVERGTLCATLFFILADGIDQVAASMFISSQVAILASSLRTQVKARRAMHDFTPHQASESLTWASAAPSITTTDWRIRWLTVLVQLRISDRGKIVAVLC